MSGKTFISIYRSSRREGMYLYLKRGAPVDELPEALRQQFGKPVHAMDMVLTPERKLARADAARVLDSVQEKGFYLQMPPAPEEGLSTINVGSNANAYIQSPEKGAGS